MDWDGFGFATLLQNVVTSVYPFDFPSVFLEKIQQISIFHVPSPLQAYCNTYNTYCQEKFINLHNNAHTEEATI